MTLNEALTKVVRSPLDGDLMDTIDSSAPLQRYLIIAAENKSKNPDLVSRIAYTCIRVGQEMERGRRDEQVLNALRASVYALRGYQYGNSSPHLAEEVADMAETILSAAEMGVRHG